MRCELNFKVDEYNNNKHIYSREILKCAFDNRLSAGPLPITPLVKDVSNAFSSVPISKYIGIVQDYVMEKDGTVVVNVQPVSTIYGFMFEDMLKIFKLNVAGIGMLDKDKRFIQGDYMLIALYISKDKYENI